MNSIMNVIEKIEKAKIIPAVKIDNKEDAVSVAKALSAGGINIIEITYRTECAGNAISAVVKNCPDILVGAGTVTNLSIAKDAVKNGAKFIVMPGFDRPTVDWCIKKGIPVIPGVATPTEVMTCTNRGLKILKLFPAGALGGKEYLKALAGPFGDVKFIPTGGINSENAGDYLAQKNVIAVGGSWLTPPQALKEKNFGIITAEAKKVWD